MRSSPAFLLCVDASAAAEGSFCDGGTGAILTICCRIESVPEFAGITFALPHLVSGSGALAAIAPPLDDGERASLQRSASILRDAIGSLRLAS